MAWSLIWIQGSSDPGWACSSCRWKFPVPTLLSSDEAKSAYDRLAASKFRAHICETQTTPASVKANTGPTFAERAGRLIKAGYKPKDAVELVTEEIILEHGHEPNAKEKASAEAEEFLYKIRKGLI
jgi:hypothetical protein